MHPSKRYYGYGHIHEGDNYDHDQTNKIILCVHMYIYYCCIYVCQYDLVTQSAAAPPRPMVGAGIWHNQWNTRCRAGPNRCNGVMRISDHQ